MHLDIDGLYLLYGPTMLSKIGIFGYIHMFRFVFGVIAVLIYISMYFERTLATVKYRTYENYRSITLIILLLVYLVLLGIISMTLFFMGKKLIEWGGG
jgi:asparagine N-glycosylation enzyme membrane subunit Stt3